MSPGRRRFWFAVRVALYVFLVLVGAAIALPYMVNARWSSSVEVTFKFKVVDAQTGKAVPNARTLVWPTADVTWVEFQAYEGHHSATTDLNGNCVVHSYAPASGTGNKGRLSMNSTIWVWADGYEPWEKPCAALLGRVRAIKSPWQTNCFSVTVTLKRS